jgi:hypothetical protein
VQTILNPVLQQSFQAWQAYGEQVKKTETKWDDLGYMIGTVPLEILAGKLKGLGYELKPVPIGDGEDGSEVVQRSETEVDTGEESPAV